MPNITYKRTFQHEDWIDNEDVVQAGGEKGFNRKFHEIESEFDTISNVVGNLDRAIDQIAADGVPDNSVTEQKIADNAVTPAKIPNGSLSANKLVNKTLPLSKLKATPLTGRSIIPPQSDQEIEITRLSDVEGGRHTFLLASVIAISRPDRPGQGVRSVRLEWKLQRLVDSDGDTFHLLMVHNFSSDRVEVEHKVYVLAES